MILAMFRSARSSTSNRLSAFVLPAAIVLLSQQAIAAEPSAAQLFQNGVTALGHSDYAAAEQSFRDVLHIEPHNLGALGNLGVIYARTNRNTKAIEVYRQALDVAPHEEGLLLNLGLAYFKSENYARALPFFAEVEEKDPANLQAQELASACRIYTGALPKAIESLQRLRTADPNRAGVLYLLGVAYTKAKQPELAKPVFAEMLNSAVNPVQSNFLLGKAYYDGGQFAEAEKSFLDVLQADPSFPGARLEFAKVLISKRENEKAIDQLRTILQKNENDADASYLLGAFEVQLEQYGAGINHLHAAEKTFPDSWALNFYLGKAALRTGQSAEAVRRLARAAELNSDNPSTFYLLSQAYRNIGQTEQARVALQRVKALGASNLGKEEAAVGNIPRPQ